MKYKLQVKSSWLAKNTRIFRYLANLRGFHPCRVFIELVPQPNSSHMPLELSRDIVRGCGAKHSFAGLPQAA